jgi:hypothetical protein
MLLLTNYRDQSFIAEDALKTQALVRLSQPRDQEASIILRASPQMELVCFIKFAMPLQVSFGLILAST